MTENLILLLAVIGTVFLSAFFSGTENAFLSLNKFKVNTLAYTGSKRGTAIKSLLADIEGFYSTILVGNNISNFVFSSLLTVLFLKTYPRHGALISSIAGTTIMVIFGEIVPKNILRERAHYFAYRLYPLLAFFRYLFLPVSAILTSLLKGIYALLKVQTENRLESISRKELFTVISSSQMAGIIPELDPSVIERIFSFKEKKVHQAVIPVNETLALPGDTPVGKIKQRFVSSHDEFLLLYHGKHTHLIGYTVPGDLVNIDNNDLPVSEVMRDIVFIPEVIPLLDAVPYFEEETLLVVVDEYGSIAGVLTLEEVIDEILGERENILTASLQKEIDMIVSGKTSLEQLRIDFGIYIDDPYVNTIAGHMIRTFRRIPRPGESLVIGHYRFTVIDASPAKVKKVKIMFNEKKDEGDA
ncbi:MAG TPA: hemolysin family protein [Candidatus Mcinerneyibacteriales bacterium]|nr:hemolysin family protein [Candidatus Mcinerneyibacteriales bacterium]